MLIAPETPGWVNVDGIMLPEEGTQVRIRQWDDLWDEFNGMPGDPEDIECALDFVLSMRHLCGAVGTVTRVGPLEPHSSSRYAEIYLSEDLFDGYNYSSHMIEPLDFPIIPPPSPTDVFVQQLQRSRILTVTEKGPYAGRS